MRIKSLRLRSGGEIPLENKITVFVGPNNSGKSQTLKDIRFMMDRNKSEQSSTVILQEDNSVFEIPSYNEIMEDVIVRPSNNTIDYYTIEGIGSNLLDKESMNLHKSQENQIGGKGPFFDWFSKFYLALMNAETRLRLASQVNSFNTEFEKPGNIIQALLLNKDAQKKLQSAFKVAFNQDIKLDYSMLQFLCLRTDGTLPEIPLDPTEAIKITKNIPRIDNQGDGYRSFAGIVLGLLLSKQRIILLDEPEAFLHPAQAYFLGKWIADNGNYFQSQILICTHSASFLKGIIDGNSSVGVFRLNRIKNVTDYIPISAESTKQLSINPILSSQRVLEGLFHKGVVICEADADRSVYQLVASVCHQSNGEILFIHAHNKQTLAVVSAALQQARIPCAVVADIDILNGKNDLEKVYKALTHLDISDKLESMRSSLDKFIEGRSEDIIFEEMKAAVATFSKQLENGEHSLEGAKSALKRIRKDAGKWSAIKKNGITVFDAEHLPIAQQLFKELRDVGIFIVPVGELEGWMDLGVNKSKWTVSALAEIQEGRTPEELKEFVESVLDYFSNQMAE